MKNILFRGIFAVLLLAGAATAFGQTPVPQVEKAAPQKDLPPCKTAVAKAQSDMQIEADAQCSTVYRCVECIEESSKAKTCKNVSAQPRCGSSAKIGKSDDKSLEAVAEPFHVMVFQYHCYAGGTSLEAAVVQDGQPRLDGPEQVLAYSFLWEIDGAKGGHSPSVGCVIGKRAVVRVTKLATGETVSRVVNLASNEAVEKAPGNRQLIAAYRKTSCLGACPTFELQIFDDGLVKWNGIANVGTPGKAEKQMDKKVAEGIVAEANKNKFFDLKDRYPDYQVWDAPATIIYIKSGERRKQVTAILDIPREFTEMAKKFEEIMAQNRWKGKYEPKPSVSNKPAAQGSSNN